MGQQLAYLGGRQPPREPDGWPGHGLQCRPVPPLADDNQGQAQLVARLHGQVDALVRDEPGDDQKIIARRAGAGTIGVGVDGG